VDESTPEVITLNELETAIMHDLDLRDTTLHAHESVKDKAECILFFSCLVACSALMLFHVLTSLIPMLLGLPSGRVILMRFFDQ
jgi:hypothetical protein